VSATEAKAGPDGAGGPPPADPPGGRGERAAALGLLLLLVALFHGPSLRNGFVYDDHWTVADNTFLRDPGNLTALVGPGPARAGVPDAGRPVLVATEVLDHALWGLRPWGFHLQNVVWHAAVTALFFLGAAALTGGLLLPFAAAGLFALHPLNVEVVAAINYREDLLATFFVLAALAAVAAARRRRMRAGDAGAGWLAAAFAFATVGCFSKESAYMAPFLLVVLDVFAPPLRAGRRWYDVVPLAAAAAGAIAWRAWVMEGVGVVSRAAEIPAAHRSVPSAVPRAAEAFVAGLADLVVPWNLSPEYADRAGSGGFPVAGAVSLAALGVLLALAWRGRRRHPWPALGLAAAVVAYLPTAGLVPITNLRADRYFYLPALGLCLAGAALLLAALARIPWLRRPPWRWLDLPRPWVVLSVLLLVLGMRSLRQGRIWRSDLGLWQHAAAVAPASPRVWRGLAEARLRLGDARGAREAVERSLFIADDQWGRELLGLVLLEQGELAAACAHLERALAAGGAAHRVDRLNNLGRCEQARGRLDRAVAHLAEARRLAPRAERPALNLAAAQQARGEVEAALETLRALVAAVPASREGWRQLGEGLEKAGKGKGKEAAEARRRAAALGASDPAVDDAPSPP
jgi:protein O-mannosyl-transferase